MYLATTQRACHFHARCLPIKGLLMNARVRFPRFFTFQRVTARQPAAPASGGDTSHRETALATDIRGLNAAACNDRRPRCIWRWSPLYPHAFGSVAMHTLVLEAVKPAPSWRSVPTNSFLSYRARHAIVFKFGLERMADIVKKIHSHHRFD
jgi:hypothetical protein